MDQKDTKQSHVSGAGADHSCEVIPTSKDLRKKCVRSGNANIEALKAIANAEQALEKLSVNFDDWMAAEAKQLASARDAAKAVAFSNETVVNLFQASHNLKGQATTLGYPLADEICSSLCRLIDAMPDKSRLPVLLVDQHVDSVTAFVREGAKGGDNPKASVLAKRLSDVTREFLAEQAARVPAS